MKSGKKGLKMKCPKEGCPLYISEDFVQKICDADTFNKFKQFKQEKEVMQNGFKKFCPNPKCENVVVVA